MNTANATKKSALITGAAQGIGAKIAEVLAEDGYNIIIADIIPGENARDIIGICESKGARVMFSQADVSDYASCEKLIKQITETEDFNLLYALVNNAGIIRDSLLMRMPEENFDKVISVNLKSVYNLSKLVLPGMIKAREGRIVNIASVAGIYGNAGQTNYASSKAGIIGFTKSLAKEVGGRSVTVNAVAPGFIVSDMTANINNESEIKSRIALKSLGKPEDVANAVSFLVSERASYITGHVLSVDGGMSL
ncbi:MAG: 3-oxoacyl-ACP reductase FabG [Oscillospiraceae bacterium]|nr:3-oxoacyl-ACP reductase FabG [Oscillospiraceae bacterium]